MKEVDKNMILKESFHPCFQNGNSHGIGQIHLPVAKFCNIQCGYCDRKYDCVNESRPRVTSRLMTPEEAVDWAFSEWEQKSEIRSAIIAGPGEPLANETTFKTMELMRSRMPWMKLCLSTNGYWLPYRLSDLKEMGISSLTVTRNAMTVETAEKIYDRIDGFCAGNLKKACEYLLQMQQEGIQLASEAGIQVKVNTVLIPGINEKEIEKIAEDSAKRGAIIMNLVPLIPIGRMSSIEEPSAGEMNKYRNQAARYLRQFTNR